MSNTARTVTTPSRKTRATSPSTNPSGNAWNPTSFTFPALTIPPTITPASPRDWPNSINPTKPPETASSTSPRPRKFSKASSPASASASQKAGQNSPGFQRIIIEKPFGRDLKSAEHLNAVLLKYFQEKQIFRIDHYLGKETVQNLMVMRFANSIFEPIWNYKYIDHVQITVSETLSADDRAGYYDKSGATRDMIQNHMFQLMALVAMEPPAALDAVSIRDEKVKVYKCVRPVQPGHVDSQAVRGQYGPGEFKAKSGLKTTDGYLKARGVAPGSTHRNLRRPSNSSSTTGAGAACPSTSAPANASPKN